MVEASPSNSPRRDELLEAAYEYVLRNGLSGLSLRPLAAAIGTSPRVLLYLFGSKEQLIRALIERARIDEASFAAEVAECDDFATAVRVAWQWMAAPAHRPLVTVWLEAYAAAVADPGGPLNGFARQTVDARLALLAAAQPAPRRRSKAGQAERRLALAVLRGAMLDVLATGDLQAATAAVDSYVGRLG